MVYLKICKSSDFIGNNAEKFNYDQFSNELKKGILSEYPEEMIIIEFVEQNTKFVEIETDNETLAQNINDIVETIDISEDKFYWSIIENFEKNLKWNGQIERFFDEEGTEYDLCCANAHIERGNKIIIYKWTIQGYRRQ